MRVLFFRAKFIALFFALLLQCSLGVGQRRLSVKEQTSFGSEMPIAKRTKLPKDVLEQLAEFDGGALQHCQQSAFSRRSNIADHFAASSMRVNSDSQQDLIVQAQTPCFMGAHNTTFWVFTKVEQRLFPGYDLIFALRADFLNILKTSTNGYRDIKTASHTALELYSTTWKFDGQKYQPKAWTIEDFRTKKVVRVRCATSD